MGSLISTPKASKQSTQQTKVVYVTEPADTTSTASTTTAAADTAASSAATTTDTAAAQQTEDEAQATARVQGLLQRNRGIFGTVLTGFKGLLSPSGVAPQRKTLLGE